MKSEYTLMGSLRFFGWSLLLVASLYVAFAWMFFAIGHTKAGQGAFYVHFKEVITFKDVPALKE